MCIVSLVDLIDNNCDCYGNLQLFGNTILVLFTIDLAKQYLDIKIFIYFFVHTIYIKLNELSFKKNVYRNTIYCQGLTFINTC